MTASSPLSRLRRWLTQPDLLAVLTLALLWGLFFWRLLTPEPADRVLFQPGDFTLHYFPFADYMADRVWQGQLPLWNPYNHAGDPFAANVQWATWYPARWLAIALAGPAGWRIEAFQIEVAAHCALASLLAYAFLRVLVGRPVAALAGSVIFAYGGYLTGYPMLQPNIGEAIVWLPLVLLGLHLSLLDARWRVAGGLLAGVAFGLSILAGHPQTTLQMGYLALAYLIFAGWRRRAAWWAILARAGLMFGVGAGLAAIQLLPGLEFARLSYRVQAYHYADKAHGFAPAEFLQLMWPPPGGLRSPLYVGVAGLALAAGALLRRRAEHAFWGGVIGVSMLLALGGNSIVYDFFYLLAPGISMFRSQERAIALAVMAVSVLAAYQLDWLLSPPSMAADADRRAERRFAWLVRGHLIVAGLALAVLAVAALMQGHSAVGAAANVVTFVTLMSLLLNAWYAWLRAGSAPLRGAGALLVALVVVDLFTFGARSENFVPDTPASRVQPPPLLEYVPVPDEIAWRIDGAAGLEGYGTLFRLPDIYGTGPLVLDSVERLRQIPVDRFWEVLAVRYVTLAEGVPMPEGVPFELVAMYTNYSGQPYILVELTDPRPWVHLIYDYRSSGGAEFARQIMADPSIDLREVAVTRDPLPIDLPGERPADSRVAFRWVTPERLEMTVSTRENALLTVAMPNYPGWRAVVNGKRVPVVDTYAGLIGIPIAAGEDQAVRLEFAPQTVMVGGAVSVATLLGVGIAAVAFAARRRGAVGA